MHTNGGIQKVGVEPATRSAVATCSIIYYNDYFPPCWIIGGASGPPGPPQFLLHCLYKLVPLIVCLCTSPFHSHKHIYHTHTHTTHIHTHTHTHTHTYTHTHTQHIHLHKQMQFESDERMQELRQSLDEVERLLAVSSN